MGSCLKLLTADELWERAEYELTQILEVASAYDYGLPKSHLYYFHPLSRNAG